MSSKSIFQKIVAGEIPASIVYQDEQCAAIRDINPQAPVHLLVFPKKLIPTLNDVSPEESPVIGHIYEIIKQLAASEGLEKGYRVVVNCGEHGGQSVPHLHFHLLGGRVMKWPPG